MTKVHLNLVVRACLAPTHSMWTWSYMSLPADAVVAEYARSSPADV